VGSKIRVPIGKYVLVIIQKCLFLPFRECACPVFVEFVETCSLKWLDSTISTRHGKSDSNQGPK